MITPESEREMICDLRDFYLSEIQTYRDKFPSNLKMADSLFLASFSMEKVYNYEFSKIQKLYYLIYPDRKVIFEKIKIPKKERGRPCEHDRNNILDQVKKHLSDGIVSTQIHKKIGFESYVTLRKYLRRQGMGFKKLKKELNETRSKL